MKWPWHVWFVNTGIAGIPLSDHVVEMIKAYLWYQIKIQFQIVHFKRHHNWYYSRLGKMFPNLFLQRRLKHNSRESFFNANSLVLGFNVDDIITSSDYAIVYLLNK